MSKKILVVDDDVSLANALELALHYEGFTVDKAYDGEEAISKIMETDYDIVLLDLVMPKINGFTVLEKTQNKTLRPKFIITSNLSQKTDIDKAKDLGASEFLVKSNITLDYLTKHLQELN